MSSYVATLSDHLLHSTIPDAMYALPHRPVHRRRGRRASPTSMAEALRWRVVDWLMEHFVTLLMPPVSPSASVSFWAEKRTASTRLSVRNSKPNGLITGAPPPPYMVPVGTTMPRALDMVDIIELIVNQLSVDKADDRASLARLAHVSHIWFGPSVSRLYRTMDVKMLCHLLQMQSHPHNDASSTTFQQDWDRFTLYSDCVSNLQLRNCHWNKRNPARWRGAGLHINLFRDLGLQVEADPSLNCAFLRLQHLDIELPYQISLGATVVLLSPGLQSLKLSREVDPVGDTLPWSTRRDLKAYCYGLCEWTPRLEMFGLSGRAFDDLSDANLLEGLRHLRSLHTLELPSELQGAMLLLEKARKASAEGLLYEDNSLMPWSTFDHVTTLQLYTSPDAVTTLLDISSFPQLRTFEITITAPKDVDSIAKMNALLVEKAASLENYCFLRTGARWKRPFPIQPRASDFAPLAELQSLENMQLCVFLATDEFPYAGMDDHTSVLLLLAHNCSKLRSLAWDWPIATANLPTPRTLAQLASVSQGLKQLTIPANLTFAHLCQTEAQPCLERLILATGTVYINRDKSHRWLSALWPQARIEDRS
ncbi:hypothetical protein CALVIDRAFT_130323 [Calocera viscosa TUFC12733]|uniref:Uncharacterized protein n=1 Tax=Calocera viscosa (strain TUFC12733) TaxID=1330018 RepID=A0A167RTW4_CALVF|nr:hypothetical protein CALVIDRAFT_130323 [Calocera viscosa TUFC12733]